VRVIVVIVDVAVVSAVLVIVVNMSELLFVYLRRKKQVKFGENPKIFLDVMIAIGSQQQPAAPAQNLSTYRALISLGEIARRIT
jgi:hypothetical protein